VHHWYQRHRWQTGGKIAAGINDTGGKIDAGGKLPPVSTTPAANNGYNIRLQSS
jgi:hypothetical protein